MWQLRGNNMNKQSYTKTSKLKKPSMTGEKLLSRISFYIIVITILMLLGLINKDGPWRGFPIPWIFNMLHVMMEYFIPSLILNTAVVVGSDILARLFISVKEPRLKIHTKLPDVGDAADETIEMRESELTESYEAHDISEVGTVFDELEDPEIETDTPKKPRHFSQTVKYNTKSENNNMKTAKGIIFLISALAIIFTLLPMILIISEEGIDPFNDYNDDDIVIDASWDDSYGDAESAVFGNAEYLFEKMSDSDNYELSEIFTDEESEDIINYTDWDNISYRLIDLYISEDESFSISKYYVNDYDDNPYFIAIAMEIEKEGDDLYIAAVKGMALCPDVIGLDDSAEYTNKVLIDHFKEISSNEILFGEAKRDGASILVWDPYTDVFGREKKPASSETV